MSIEYVEAYAAHISEVLNFAADHLQLTIRIRLFMAKGGGRAANPMQDLGVELHEGRPDIPALLADTVSRSNSLAVGVCGPTPLVHTVQSAARRVDVAGLGKIAVHS